MDDTALEDEDELNGRERPEVTQANEEENGEEEDEERGGKVDVMFERPTRMEARSESVGEANERIGATVNELLMTRKDRIMGVLALMEKSRTDVNGIHSLEDSDAPRTD